MDVGFDADEGPVRDRQGRFVKGHRPLLGRKRGKGRAAKLRKAILTAIEELGGVEFVKAAAQEDPVGVLRIAASLVPKELREIHEGQGLVLNITPYQTEDKNELPLPHGAEDFFGGKED